MNEVSRLRLALLVLALLLGSYWRLAPVGSALLFGDEFHSLRELRRGYADIVSSFSPHGSGMALPLIQRALADLVGLDHWTIRAPAFLASLAVLFCTYPIGRRMFGSSPAAIATALVAASSIQIYYAHFGRAYAMMSLLLLLLVGVLQRALDLGNASLRRCSKEAMFELLSSEYYRT